MTEVAENSVVSDEMAPSETAHEEKVESSPSEKENDVKSDVEEDHANGAEEISELENDIIRQIEYYFGDANLRKDKFLLQKISEDDDGWVPLTTILTFKRLAALTTDVDVIINALEKSVEGLIEISEDKTKIRRHSERPIPEFNEELRKEIASRSAYVKGFPLDTEMSELIEFFKPFEKVLNIQMRKYLEQSTKKYKFKGSVFVTFSSKEECEAFINKEKVEFKETALIRKWLLDYVDEKHCERETTKAKKEEKIHLPKGTVLYFEGCSEDITREHIKEALSSFDYEVAFIDFSKGNKSGYIRFKNENNAQECLDKLEENKLEVNKTSLTFRTLKEDEEREYLKKALEQMKQRRNHQNHNKGRNRKRKLSEKSPSEPSVKK